MKFGLRKALAITISMIMLLSVVALTVQADAAVVTVTNVTFADDQENPDVVDVTVTFTAPDSAVYLTMLASTAEVVTESNLSEVAVGLDQFDNASQTTHTFKMKKPTETTNIYVRMGGTNATAGEAHLATYRVVKPGDEYPAGDANMDEEFDIKDVTHLLQALVGKVELTGYGLARADVTGDGNVTIADAVKMLELLAE